MVFSVCVLVIANNTTQETYHPCEACPRGNGEQGSIVSCCRDPPFLLPQEWGEERHTIPTELAIPTRIRNTNQVVHCSVDLIGHPEWPA